MGRLSRSAPPMHFPNRDATREMALTFKVPEEELAQLLAQLPPWAENILWERWSAGEFWAWLQSDLFDRWPEITDGYENILKRCPERWRAYCKAHEEAGIRFARTWLTPSERPGPGAPRHDTRAEQAAELLKNGMNLPQVAAELKKQGIETTPDALRHLLSRRSKPDKT